MRPYFIIVLFLSLIAISCENPISYKPIPSQVNKIFNKNLDVNLKDWHFKDLNIDTIPGISLNRTYDSLIINKKGKEIIVAVIDMEVDLKHENLKNVIWINNKEIEGNNLDDDKNGYIDDIYGWNFLGNRQGENNLFVNYEYTRILKKFNSKFKDKASDEISSIDSIDFKIYKLAQNYYNNRMQFAVEDTVYANMISKSVFDSKKALKVYFKNENYTLKDLDSLKKVYPKNEELHTNILKRSNFIKYGFTTDYVNDYKLKAFERINKLLNLDYNDRVIQNDNINDINDSSYGSKAIGKNTYIFNHGTKMAGIIANIGLKNEIKIMPISISAFGDEHDKDIALAIKYAVDNGAKIINMSFSKEFSLHYEWVANAIKYAEKKNVLIIKAASNDGINLDLKPYLHFPNDHDYYSDIEIVNNFLTIGATSSSLDENLKLSYSNYGKKEVDIFAPGENIYTYLPNQKFTNESGGTSSAAAITSGMAALIFSYYPKLKAMEVKEIILNSGIEYNIEIKTPTEQDKNNTVPFNKLSKSGKIVNLYNAFLMANEY